MIRSAKRTAALVLMVIVGLTISVTAETSTKPAIIAAFLSEDQTVLFVDGENFNSHPVVKLGGQSLEGVVVDVTGQRLSALMPDSLPPGTYLLEVTSRNWTAQFAVAVGTVGPAGPAGPTGATGPAGATGADGAPGTNGVDGAPGATGATGPAGPIGPSGPAGATGATGPVGPTGPMPNYVAGWINGSAQGTTPLIRSGTGSFTAIRWLVAGSYRITIPEGTPARFFMPSVTPVGLATSGLKIARVTQIMRDGVARTFWFEVEIRDMAGVLVDGDFSFIAVERSGP